MQEGVIRRLIKGMSEDDAKAIVEARGDGFASHDDFVAGALGRLTIRRNRHTRRDARKPSPVRGGQ
jgi:hypothetical protein